MRTSSKKDFRPIEVTIKFEYEKEIDDFIREYELNQEFHKVPLFMAIYGELVDLGYVK